MAKAFQTNVLIPDEDGDVRPFSWYAIRIAMEAWEAFQKSGHAPGVFLGPDGTPRVRMGGSDGGIERSILPTELITASRALPK